MLSSVRRLVQLAEEGGVHTVLPGHNQVQQAIASVWSVPQVCDWHCVAEVARAYTSSHLEGRMARKAVSRLRAAAVLRAHSGGVWGAGWCRDSIAN